MREQTCKKYIQMKSKPPPTVEVGLEKKSISVAMILHNQIWDLMFMNKILIYFIAYIN